MSLGTPVLNDMFFLHERGEQLKELPSPALNANQVPNTGEKTGIYTIFVTNGAHIAVIGELPSKRLNSAC